MLVGLRLGAGLGDSAQIIKGIAMTKTMIKLSMSASSGPDPFGCRKISSPAQRAA
jgi:hypothetical protein